MSRHLDRALEAIDGGLQRSDEPSYGFDRLDRCWRCLKHPFEEGSDSELCSGCRAHLLGDGPDPRIPTSLESYIDDELRARLERYLLEGDGTGRPEGITAAAGPMVTAADLEALMRAAERIVDAFADFARRVVEVFSSIDWTPLLEELERIAEHAREHSRSPRSDRPTLTRGALRPPRDLRATEAPRRRPTTFRRKTP